MDKGQEELQRKVKKIRAKTGGAPLSVEEEEEVKKLEKIMAGPMSLQSYCGDYRHLQVPKYSTFYIHYITTITILSFWSELG